MSIKSKFSIVSFKIFVALLIFCLKDQSIDLSGVLKSPTIIRGVPVVAQWLTNQTRNNEVAGSVPALAQWVNDPALP